MTTSSDNNEKRHYCRVPFIAGAHILLEDQDWECQLLDISLKGLLIEPPQGLQMNKDDLYAISLTLSDTVKINMSAKLIHAEDNHLGLEWVDIDLDSLSTLRRLLEYNLSDPEEINREIGELISAVS